MVNPAHENKDLLQCITLATSDCNSVIDLGTGFGYHLRHAENAKLRIGVDAHLPYLEVAQRDYSEGNLFLHMNAFDFAQALLPKSIDAVLILDFIEHLGRVAAMELLNMVRSVVRKRVVVFVPEDDCPQDKDPYNMGGDHWQRHLSTWYRYDFLSLGFDVAVLENYHDKPYGKRNALFCILDV